MIANEAPALEEWQERAVAAELNRLLESPAFRTSKRCREFLEYIVRHTISGPAGMLKERSIGVELFQLPQDYDTGQHTIVRVTANEVRKKLAQSYLTESGAGHPVRIDLPPGSYSAEFRWETPAVAAAPPSVEAPLEAPVAVPVEAPVEPPAPEPPTAEPPRSRWLTRNAMAYAAAVVLLAVSAFLFLRSGPKPVAAVARTGGSASSGTVPGAAAASDDLRIAVGATTPYVDRSGRSWGADRFFTGGVVLSRPDARILRTLDPDIYRRARQGDFQYDIPLKPGSYELHLHFAETGLADFISAESSGEGQRLLRVMANGKLLLNAFDTVADADGANVADERVFRDISPGKDGYLHLAFSSIRGNAILNGIELLRVSPGTVRPVRLRSGWSAGWQDPEANQWRGDSYFLGGNALVRTTNPARDADAPDVAIYGSERWGHFTYAIPVADGRYRVTLRFCEGHYGKRNTGVGGEGSRLFDVFANGVALLRNFDIMKAAGGEGKPIDRAFAGLRPNAQGKIVLSFVPVVGMACVNGIEVAEDGK